MKTTPTTLTGPVEPIPHPMPSAPQNALPTHRINRVICHVLRRAEIIRHRVATPDTDTLEILRECLASATLEALEAHDGNVETVATFTGMPIDYVALVAHVNGEYCQHCNGRRFGR